MINALFSRYSKPISFSKANRRKQTPTHYEYVFDYTVEPVRRTDIWRNPQYNARGQGEKFDRIGFRQNE